jgi:uncharacterized phage protein gp47/JayE
MLTLAQLRTPITEDQAVQTLLDQLQALGFNVSSWQSGSVERDIVEAIGFVLADSTKSTDALSRLGYNDSATGDALTELSRSHFDNTRDPGQRTQGIVTLTDVGGIGPVSFNPGDVVVSDKSTPANTFRNITGDTLPALGFVQLTFEAEIAGADGNVANGEITELVTAIAGVTVDNTTNAPGSATWRSLEGADVESDPTLRVRNSTRWARLSIAKPADAYINIALGVTGVARARVDDTNPRGPGTVDVYIAGPSGTVGGTEVAAVQTAIDAERPVTADVLVIAATAITQDLAGSVFVDPSVYDGPAGVLETNVKQAADDYINSLPIGGVVLPPGPGGVMPRSELVGAMTAVDGTEAVALSDPAADVPVATFEIVIRGTNTGLVFTPI